MRISIFFESVRWMVVQIETPSESRQMIIWRREQKPRHNRVNQKLLDLERSTNRRPNFARSWLLLIHAAIHSSFEIIQVVQETVEKYILPFWGYGREQSADSTCGKRLDRFDSSLFLPLDLEQRTEDKHAEEESLFRRLREAENAERHSFQWGSFWSFERGGAN